MAHYHKLLNFVIGGWLITRKDWSERLAGYTSAESRVPTAAGEGLAKRIEKKRKERRTTPPRSCEG